MPTKAELEKIVESYRQQYISLVAEMGNFRTELGKLGLECGYTELMEFLNFTPEELEDL